MQKFLKYAVLFVAVSCGSASQVSKINSSSAFDPVPADKEDVIGQMRRYLGQQKFVNVEAMSHFNKRAAMADGGGLEAAMPMAESGEQREIQDSDVFKFDPQNKNKLYLLNSVRGLQRVDFSEGIAKAKLEARAQATGNYPDDMYFYSKGDKSYVVVVENNWYDRENGVAHSSQSRAVVYDAKSLEILKTLELPGELSDHRLVGNILYVATSEWPSYSWWDWRRAENNEDTNAKGHIASIDLSAKELKVIDSKDTSLPIASSSNMNIVEVKAEKGWKYYVVATLANSRWGFWDQTSVVEVMDISDAKGAIKPIMIAKPQGFIEERSQTLIKDDTLIVVSNYAPKYIQDAKQRVAVETFKFPTADAPVIDKEEAQFRLLNLDRAVKRGGLTFNSAEYNKILGDKELGLRGVVVRMDDDAGDGSKVYKLTKVVSDSFTSYGSTNELHALIRDVRVSGNHLYAFWVPSDRERLFNDPLEVYDISNPREGVTHLSHLEFPGRIDRAFPLQYEGRELIVGLGSVEPGADNENRAQHGQALLFEIVQKGKKLKAELRSEMNLASPKLNPIFQTEDKMVQMRMVDKDKGFVLFAAQKRDNWWMSGGKLIGINLSKIEDEEVFTEGAFIPAESGYLKRVFENESYEAINSFTDEALATFTPSKADGLNIGTGDEVSEAIQVLELARNIRGYVTMTNKDKKQVGVQIVNEYNWYDRDAVAKTELRFTAVDRADAELADVKVESLDGNYQGHYLSADGKALYVVVQTEKWQNTEQGYRSRVIDSVLVYKIADGKISEATKIAGEQGYPEYVASEKRVLIRTGETLSSLEINSAAGAPKITTVTEKSCEVLKPTDENQRRIYAQLKEISGNLYYTYGVYGQVEDKNLSYQTKYLMPVTLTADTLTCGKAVNVPGEVVSISSDLKTAVTIDESLKVLVEKRFKATEEGQEDQVSYNAITKKNLVALALDANEGVATLKRLEDAGSAQPYGVKVVGDALLFVDSDQSYGDIMPMHGMGMRGSFMPRFGGGDLTYSVNVLRVDNDYNFIRTAFALASKENSQESIQLASILSDSKAGSILLTTQGNMVRAYRFSVEGGLQAPLKLQSVNEKFEKSEPSDSIKLSHAYALGGYSYYGNSETEVSLNPATRSVEVPAGTYGVIQFYIGE